MIEADYVIVGGGSAGCVLAQRLSENSRHTVVLLEAGGADRGPWLQIPIGYGKSFYDPAVNWMYRTEPDPGLAGRQGYWPRGKVLGGSSAINAMVYIRGHPSDFDGWAALGNPGWSWADVAPVFRRLECAPHRDVASRGHSGPLCIADVSRDHHPLCTAFYGAGGELGLPFNADFNGPTMEGIGPYEITTRHGRRMSAARAYLRSAIRRRNLRVELRAHAVRVRLDGRRAVGAEYVQDGETLAVRAHREVILAAGAINTPQLLQLSGIGPPEPIRRHGIALAHELPAVGANLQDHVCIDHVYRARVPSLNEVLRSWHGRVRIGIDYLLRGRGPLSLSINQGGGFVRSREGLAAPDMQLYFCPLSYTRLPPGTRPLMQPDPFPGLLTSVQPCRPQSRGRLTIRSADPRDPPVIEPGTFSAPGDLDDMLAGAQFLRRLAATPTLVAVIERELLPGPQVQSRDELIGDIRARASTVFHPVATCRMGPDPAKSVVDARLRVHGLAGLRVIDASVFPSLTSGNTNAPVLMVAEKGADLVLADAGES